MFNKIKGFLSSKKIKIIIITLVIAAAITVKIIDVNKMMITRKHRLPPQTQVKAHPKKNCPAYT